MSSFVESLIRLSIKSSIKFSFALSNCLLTLSFQSLQLLFFHSIVTSLHWSSRLRIFDDFRVSKSLQLLIWHETRRCRFRQVNLFLAITSSCFFRWNSYTASRSEEYWVHNDLNDDLNDDLNENLNSDRVWSKKKKQHHD